jgi:poly(beta-D-mannuronate) lyase
MNSKQFKIRGILKSSLLLGNFVLMLFFTSFKTNAAIINVSSIAALQTASNTASPGDIIVLANNTYLNSTLNITTSNITVRAATPGGVILNGNNSITITGDNVTFSGFQFLSGRISGEVISVIGDYALLNQLNFNGYSAKKYINISGQYDEVSYCNFENKPNSAPDGNLVHIEPNGTDPNYAKIRYCSFKNMNGAGGNNGNECIRIANSAQSTFLCRTIVEYCYFENTGDGDDEAISVRSRENVLRFNTFRNNQDAMMSFRNSNDNVAYGNFFIGAGGIQIKEANNIYCYNNYFENSGVGGSVNAVRYVYTSPNLNNINFIHNTFVECGLIDLDNGSSNNTWANNIFKKITGNIFTGSPAGINWSGNIYQGNLGVTIPSGMTNSDPLLTINSNNYFGLSSLSPAINTASENYPTILDIANVDDDPSLLFDISGQPRPVLKSEKDIGSDEFTTGNITNHPLVLNEVGPSYLGGPGNISLPVTLNRFSGTVVEQDALLSWTTASELNMAGYEVERSINGKDFTRVGNRVDAMNSTLTQHYQLIDKHIFNKQTGNVYYRLKMINMDGGSNYSGMLVLSLKGNSNLRMYPNPAQENIFLEVVLSGEKTQFYIYNAEGRLIRSEQRSVVKGRNLLEFNIADLPKGIYYLQYENFVRKTMFIKN